MVLGGFGAPLFLLLAGVAVSLSAGSKARRGVTGAAAARCRDAPRARDLRPRVPLPGPGVDPGLVVLPDAAAGRHPQCHGAGDRRRGRIVGRVFDGRAGAWSRSSRMTLAITLLTPIVRTASWLAGFPDPSRPTSVRPGPTAAFHSFRGPDSCSPARFVGALLDRQPPTVPRADTRVNTWFGVGGAAARRRGVRRIISPHALRPIGLLDLIALLLPDPSRACS